RDWSSDVCSSDLDIPPPEVSEELQMALMRLPWPGNVRQLMNVVQSMMVIAEGGRLALRHLPPDLQDQDSQDASELTLDGAAGMSLDQIEKQAIRNALRLNRGNREQAARMLGLGERTRYRKLKEYVLK